MPTARACPDISQYKSLSFGQLSSADKEALLAHLEGCEACATQIEALSENDTLIELIRMSRTQAKGRAGQTIAQMVEQLRALRPTVQPAGEAPTQAPIFFACSGCGEGLQVEVGQTGKNFKCPSCHMLVSVPGGPATDEEQTLSPTSTGCGAVKSPMKKASDCRTGA